MRLRSLRLKAGLTVEELAEKSGVPISSIYNWESASRSPSIENLVPLAKALSMKTRTLLPDE